MLVAFAAIFPAQMSALSLYVNDTSAVSVLANWKEVPEEFVNSGYNLNNATTGSLRLAVNCNEGYIMKTVTVDDEVTYSYDDATEAMKNAVWEFAQVEGRPSVIKVVTQKVEPLQTGSFTIVSDADTWRVHWNLPFGAQDNLSHTIMAGEQTIKIIPGKDENVRLSRSGIFGCYSVKLNGELAEYDHNYDYLLQIKDGDVIEVTTIAPDQMNRVVISSPNEVDDFLTKVQYYTIDSETGRYNFVDVEDWSSFEVPAGAAVEFTLNFDKYKEPQTILLNGIDRGYDLIMEWDCEFPVDREVVTLSVPAEEFAPVEVVIDVDDPTRVVAVVENETDPIGLIAGENKISVMENVSIRLYAGPTGVITSVNNCGREFVSYGNQEDVYLYAPYFYNTIYPGEKFGSWVVKTSPRERTIPVHVFVENCNGSARLWTTSYNEPYYFDLTEGENLVMMHSRDMKALSAEFNTGDGEAEGHLYLNGSLRSPSAEKNHYDFSFGSNPAYGVIRIYGDENGFARNRHKVKVTSDFADTEYELYNDYIIPCKGSTHSVLEGSLFHVNMLGDEGADVYVNGEKLDSPSAMSHSFVVTAPTDLQIKKQSTGVDGVTVGEDDEPVYYNLQGIRVENPRNGIYIEVKNGKSTRKLIR